MTPEYEPEQGYFTYVPACSRCGRFVKESALKPINYRAAEGWNGAVDDGHDSHPGCGTDVRVEVRALWRSVT